MKCSGLKSLLSDSSEKMMSNKEICLVWLYNISTIVGHLMSDPIFTLILDLIYQTPPLRQDMTQGQFFLSEV